MKQKNDEYKKERTLFLEGIERALKRAAEAARKTARFYGTPIYIERDGKIIALKS
ncbi:MAG: hypothetical protein ACH346_08580 [Chthoniobacterales bacterium]